MKRSAPTAEDACAAGMALASYDALGEDALVAHISGGSRAQCMLACATLSSMGSRAIRAATVRAVVKRTFGTDLFLAAEGASVLRAWAAADDEHGTVGRVFYEQDVHLALMEHVIAPACAAIVAWRDHPGIGAISSVYTMEDGYSDAETAFAAVHNALESAFVAMLTIAEDTHSADTQLYDATLIAADAMLCSPPEVAGCSVLYMRLLVSLCDSASASSPPAALLAALATRCTTSLRTHTDARTLHVDTLAAHVRACVLSTSPNSGYLVDAASALALLALRLQAEAITESVVGVAEVAHDIFGLLADALASEDGGIVDPTMVAECVSSVRLFVEAIFGALASIPDSLEGTCAASGCTAEAVARACACVGNAVLRLPASAVSSEWFWAISAAEAAIDHPRLTASEAALVVSGGMHIVNSVFRALLAHGDLFLLQTVVDEASGLRLASILERILPQVSDKTTQPGAHQMDAAAEALPALARSRSTSVLCHAGTLAAFAALVRSGADLDQALCAAEAIEESGDALATSRDLCVLLSSRAPLMLSGLRHVHVSDAEPKLAYIRTVMASL